MFINACPEGSVKFFLNDEDKSGTLAFKAATGFVSIPFVSATEGAYDVNIEEPDRSENYDSQAHLFLQDSATIYVSAGLKSVPDAERLKRLKQISFEPNRIPPIGNRARLIFVHAFNRKSPFNTPGLILKTTGDQPLFTTTETKYGEFKSIDVDSGTYRFFGVGDVRNNYFEVKDPINDQIYAENKNPAKPIVLTAGGIYVVMISGVEPVNSASVEVQLISVAPDNNR